MSPSASTLTVATLLGCYLQCSGFSWSPTLSRHVQTLHHHRGITRACFLESVQPSLAQGRQQRPRCVTLRSMVDPDSIFDDEGEGDADDVTSKVVPQVSDGANIEESFLEPLSEGEKVKKLALRRKLLRQKKAAILAKRKKLLLRKKMMAAKAKGLRVKSRGSAKEGSSSMADPDSILGNKGDESEEPLSEEEAAEKLATRKKLSLRKRLAMREKLIQRTKAIAENEEGTEAAEDIRIRRTLAFMKEKKKVLTELRKQKEKRALPGLTNDPLFDRKLMAPTPWDEVTILPEGCRAHLFLFHDGTEDFKEKARWIIGPASERYGDRLHILEWENKPEAVDMDRPVFEVWMEGIDSISFFSRREFERDLTAEDATSIVDELGIHVADDRVLFFDTYHELTL